MYHDDWSTAYYILENNQHQSDILSIDMYLFILFFLNKIDGSHKK
jgi:hypothetical protein